MNDITIIKPGQLPTKQRYRGVCGFCGCVFEFDSEPARPGLPLDVGLRGLFPPKRRCPTEGCGVFVDGVPA